MSSKKPFEITSDKVVKILEVVDQGLCKNMGRPKPGHMCVEAAVCYALGFPHSDKPNCVSKAVRWFKIYLNDAKWTSNQARAKGLRKLAVAQLGSKEIDDDDFVNYMILETIRQIIPIVLNKSNFTKEAKECVKVVTLEEAMCLMGDIYKTVNDTFINAKTEHYRMRDIADRALLTDSVSLKVYEITNSRANASYENFIQIKNTYEVIRQVFYNLNIETFSKTFDFFIQRVGSIDRYKNTKKNSDDILNLYAKIGLEVLIKCNSPGCKYLYLCE